MTKQRVMKLSPRATTTIATASALTLLAGTGALAVTATSFTEYGGAARLSGDQTSTVRSEAKRGRADNVILLVGDGMGDSEITSARNYQYGAGQKLPGIDALPMTGSYTTYSVTKEGEVDYVPDSAATGTAWATGTKTYNNAVSVDYQRRSVKTLLEKAKAKGLKTGNVSTSEIQDATPAVQTSHVTARKCYGPSATSKYCPSNARENGGAGSITEQFLNTRPDVTLGGGYTTFKEKAVSGPWKDLSLEQQARNRGYNLVRSAAALRGVQRANQGAPLLGLFADGNLPTNWTGPAATPKGAEQPAQRCTPNQSRPGSQPSLAAMTGKAIELLDDGNGFFLQVEGASIDKQNHAANPCSQIGEVVDFDAAVQKALVFAKRDRHTTVIVTADHGHTSQIVEAGGNTPGLTATLLTNEGSPMTISYGTAPQGESQQHTGTQVRVAAYGPQAANVAGLTDQTDLHFTIARALGLNKRSDGRR